MNITFTIMNYRHPTSRDSEKPPWLGSVCFMCYSAQYFQPLSFKARKTAPRIHTFSWGQNAMCCSFMLQD